MSEFSPLPVLTIGMLGMLGIVLLASSGIITFNERSLFTAVGLVVFLMVMVILAQLSSLESTDECFDE